VNDTETLHTAACRYCIERYEHLHGLSQKYREQGVQCDAHHLHPRWATVGAIQVAVEGIVPAQYPSQAEICRALIEAGRTAESRATLTKYWRQGAILEATQDERVRFTEAVQAMASKPALTAEPLPYRRTILALEREELWARLKPRWRIETNYWIPFEKVELDEEVMVVQSIALREALGLEVLRGILHGRGVERAYKLWEHGSEPSCEMELSLFDPSWGMDEHYWFSEAMDWVIYNTHEGSSAIAGEWLLDTIKERWPMWAEHQYVPYTPSVTEQKRPLSEDERQREEVAFQAQIRQWHFCGAAATGKIEKMISLLTEGAEVNGTVPYGDGPTALYWGVMRGREEAVRFLLDHGAEVNARSEVGVTPLIEAVSNGHAAVTQLLLEAGADPNVRVGDSPKAHWRAGRTALGIALDSEYLPTLEEGRCRAQILAALKDAGARP